MIDSFIGDLHLSHPSRVRGLKLLIILLALFELLSHPSRVRGLKPSQFQKIKQKYQVAPLAGAWIETNRRCIAQHTQGSHPSRVRGLKLRDNESLQCFALRRTPRGCVD